MLAPLAALAQGPAATDEPPPDDRLRQWIANGAWHEALPDLYAERDYALAWPGDHARLDARLDAAHADGLLPHETHADERRTLRLRPDSLRRDLLLTDALLRLADALAGHRVDPEEIHEGHWFLTREVERRRATDPADLVRDALDADDPATTLLASLDALQPTHPEYHALRRDLASRFEIDYEAFQPASTHRARETATWPEAPEVRYAPREVALLRLNLERWRWLPGDFGAAHVLVNVPAARLTLRERGETVLDMEATIGQTEPDWQTPVLSDPIRSVSFFPTWTPTPTILRREIIPEAREDGGQSLYERGFDLFRGGRKLDPREVNWDRARPGTYRVVQRGGPQGALGRVKFVMPNRHFILVHDTNTPEEFDGDERALSHGCVRAEDPGALADAILTRTNGWADGRASGIIDGRPRTSGVRLRQRFPVHIVYFTAWPGEDGLQTFEDVYGRDRELAAALGIDLPEPPVQTAER
ncbi:MAG: L,D-transpeptidase family protein [Bacteroidota bacterium]